MPASRIMPRSLCLDIGERWIGVAVSDPLGITAYPLEVIKDYDADSLRAYLERQRDMGVGEVVVGLPLTKRGMEGKQAASTRKVAGVVEEVEGLELVWWDERLSTKEAEKRLKEAGKKRTGGRVDAEAAAIVLQAYLDYRRKQGGEGV